MGERIPLVYLVSIDEMMDDVLFDKMMEYVDSDRSKQIKKYHFKADRIRSLAGYYLAKYMVMLQSQLKWNEIHFGKDEYGKPYLANENHLIKYNISHSGTKVAGVISKELVGIDVEQIKETHMDIAKRWFAEEEIEYIVKEESEEGQARRFYEIWTKKESYSKAVGKGLSLSFKSFNTLGELAIDTVPYYIYTVDLEDGYAFSVCSVCPAEYIVYNEFTLEQLYNEVTQMM